MRIAISIHAAREGGDQSDPKIGELKLQFQSTPPVKAATYTARIKQCMLRFQSTPPVKAATIFKTMVHAVRIISIHAAREGGDLHFRPL